MRFLLNAILIAGCVAFVLRFTGEPDSLSTNATLENGQAVSVPTITSEELQTRIEKPATDNKATLLFLYASWCQFCKMQFPVIERMGEEYSGKHVEIIGVSLDKDADAIARYLAKRGPNIAFTTYQLENARNFGTFLEEKGAHFDGGIPHMLLFDNKANLVGEFKGMTGFDILSEATLKALNSRN